MREEFLEVVNAQGDIIGVRPRSEIHGNPGLIHRVVHVLLFNSRGALLLQKRSMNKDVAAGMWDTSVGGHVDAGETIHAAVRREMEEELGITRCEPEFLYSYMHSNHYETELVHTFSCTYDGEISFQRDEIDEIRHWSADEIRGKIGRGIFSDNFEHEFTLFMKHREGP